MKPVGKQSLKQKGILPALILWGHFLDLGGLGLVYFCFDVVTVSEDLVWSPCELSIRPYAIGDLDKLPQGEILEGVSISVDIYAR